MSKIAIQGNASGTGTLTIAAPNTNTDRTLTLPDATGTLNTSGAVNEVPAGSASAPAIYPTGDSNTGIFFPAADTVAMSTGGSERMRIDSSGNVGIGTSSPDSKLSIDHSSTSTSVLASYANIPLLLQNTSNTDNNWSVIAVQDASGDFSSYIGTQNTSQSSNTAIMAFATNGGSGATERMRIDSSGNVGINNTNPNQYATSGRVFNITGTANNSGPANLFMPGASAQLGAGFASTEVFAISNVTAAQEITRITGTNTNGFRAYIKVIVTGHTSSVGNGINIKEWFWDGGTGGVTQISTYTNGSVPTLSVTNTTNYVLIINLASSDGSNGFNGVMKVEWMIPIDFSASTYTIS